MMNAKTLRLVLLVSCCHALVHVYELSFSSVEQLIGSEFEVDTRVTGALGTTLRLPFGMCAILAGWLAGYFGSKRLLLIYLFGCSAAAVVAWFSPSLAFLFGSMGLLGMFASIYHPAGVALISHHTRADNRTLALGYHGIFGSAGIAAGPFLAALVLWFAASWRQYYLFLSIPGVLLGMLMVMRLSSDQEESYSNDENGSPMEESPAQWNCYWILLGGSMTAGVVYAAILTFLPRYLPGYVLEDWLGGWQIATISADNMLTSAILLLGILGQYLAGRLARPHTLEPMMAATFFALIPCLLWMGLAEGSMRIVAAAVFAPIFFMHQPLYNSLVAKYVPRRHRSRAFGLSFTIGFGCGSLGALFAGWVQSHWPNTGTLITYATLAAFITFAGILTLELWRLQGKRAG